MSNNNINKAILSWSTEGVAICTGVNLENHTFYIDSIDKDGYVVMWCNPLRNRFYVYPQNLVTNMRILVEQFPESWKRCTSIYISFRTRELYKMFCGKAPREIQMMFAMDDLVVALGALEALLERSEGMSDDAIANHYNKNTVEDVRRAYSALNAVYLND